MIELTRKQANVFEFIRDFIKEESMPPTRQEIASNFGWWPNAAEVHVRALIRKGALESSAKHRGIKPVKNIRYKVKEG